jgi:hypothetical protein
VTSFGFNEVHVEGLRLLRHTTSEVCKVLAKKQKIGSTCLCERNTAVWEQGMSSALETSLKGQQIGLLLNTVLNN